MMSLKITRAFGDHFAQEWVDAWICHDLKRMSSHDTDDITRSAIAHFAGESSGVLKENAAIAAHRANAPCTLNALAVGGRRQLRLY